MKVFLILMCAFSAKLTFATYYSQNEQDKFLHENFFAEKKDGVFVEIGAHNGITFSNTCFLEREMGWKGLCIEPLPDRFKDLQSNRSCICVKGCISDKEGSDKLVIVSSPHVNTEMLSGLLKKYDPRHLQRIDFEIGYYGGSYQLIDVKCHLLQNLLKEHNFDHVDFLSIDTEGGEFDILTSIDFTKIPVHVILVEDNYGDERFVDFLTVKGFDLVKKIGSDLLFVSREYKK